MAKIKLILTYEGKYFDKESERRSSNRIIGIFMRSLLNDLIFIFFAIGTSKLLKRMAHIISQLNISQLKIIIRKTISLYYPVVADVFHYHLLLY